MDEKTRQQIERRRTFAIISHPDAGKTTLTEKLLLYGGAIQSAGSVKGKQSDKHAVSDWMELEKQRGISVTSSVMQFEYNGYCINILDTPGHQDFSEDTYRTLMAADSAVMVIDAAKGIEPQTRKLFHVCAKRGIHTFDNFHGGRGKLETIACDITDTEKLDALIGPNLREELCEQVELLDGASFDFDPEAIARGKLSPVYFGSALNNFGVEDFLAGFLEMTAPPLSRTTAEGENVTPFDDGFSAFVFKIQANMNKAHRDRIAFLRICSGKFERGKEYYHIQGGRPIKLSQPQQMMAEERAGIEEAYAGDIIGVFDPGIFSIGDTVCAKDHKITFAGIPTFAPEHFAMVEQIDSMKRKQFAKGMEQIAKEGAIRIFFDPDAGFERVVVGVIGVLQYDVLKFRMKSEYGVEYLHRELPYQYIKRVADDSTVPSSLNLASDTRVVRDVQGHLYLLFTGQWSIKWATDNNPRLQLLDFDHI